LFVVNRVFVVSRAVHRRRFGPLAGFAFFVGTSFELPHSCFHLLARLEGYDEFLRYGNLFTRARITSFASCTPLHFEHSEIAELDAVIFDQRFDNGVERLLDDLLRLELCQPNLVRDGLYDLFFGHDRVSRPKSSWDPEMGPIGDVLSCSKCNCSKH
jgi:hypothetical protein